MKDLRHKLADAGLALGLVGGLVYTVATADFEGKNTIDCLVKETVSLAKNISGMSVTGILSGYIIGGSIEVLTNLYKKTFRQE